MRCQITLDKQVSVDLVIARSADGSNLDEAMRYVAAGEHKLDVACEGDVRVEKLVVRAIPELIHCGLGFDSAIKGYGQYDMEFLKKDILPNVTTLIVPHNIKLCRGRDRRLAPPGQEVRRRGRHQRPGQNGRGAFRILDRLLGQGAVPGRDHHQRVHRQQPRERRRAAQTPSVSEREASSPAPRVRRGLREICGPTTAIEDKMLYAYFGGSGKKLNQEDHRPDVRPHADRLRLSHRPRALHLTKSPASRSRKDALQVFVDGIADWEAKEPGVKQQMVIAFGLFSMPPGGINKQPNVDYHVWMDQQMNVVANHPVLAGIGGLELVDVRCWPTRKRCASSASCIGTMPSKAKRTC